MAAPEIDIVLAEIQAKGFQISHLNLDGRNHRFALDPRDSKRSGSYRAIRTKYGCEIQIRNFRDPDSNCRYRLTGERNLSEEELKAHEKEVEAEVRKQEAQSRIRQETVAIECRARWERSRGNPSHPKLTQRRLKGSYGTRTDGSVLLIPCCDHDGKLFSLQSFGYEPKDKGYFPKGGRQKGLFHLIGKFEEEGVLFITEGFVTGASLYQISGERFACAVAFSANNLTDVAVSFRKLYPSLEIIISGDRDRAGIQGSQKAAKLAKARILIPEFGFEHPDFKDWNDFLKQELSGGEAMAVSQISDYRNKSQNGDFETFFIEWVKRNDLSMSYRGEFSLGEKLTAKKVIDSKLFLDAKQAHKGNSQQHCQAALTIWMSEQRARLKKEIVDPILPYHPNDELDRFVHAITDESPEKSIAIMKHFIWQVKRKILGLEVFDHVMPVITGAQRSGKSQAVSKLLSPIRLLCVSKSVSSICDERQFPMFELSYVIVLDEMAKAEYADNETLKHVITEPELHTREYHQQNQLYIRNNATLIGTSNFPLESIIRDSTGMRRFFEIRSKEVCDWATINTIDYRNLWLCVDPKATSYIAPFLKEIQADQELYRYRSEVEEFHVEHNFAPDPTAKTAIKTYRQIYETWCLKNNFKPRSAQALGWELKRLGFPTKTIDRRTYFILGWGAGIPMLP